MGTCVACTCEPAFCAALFGHEAYRDVHASAVQPAAEPARKRLAVSVGQSSATQHAHSQSGAPHGGDGGGFAHSSTAPRYLEANTCKALKAASLRGIRAAPACQPRAQAGEPGTTNPARRGHL